MSSKPVGFRSKGKGSKRRVYPIYAGYKGIKKGSGMSVSSVVEAQKLRSKTAQRIDAQYKAPIAKTNEQWLSEPNRYDIPGIDTPIQKEKAESQNITSIVTPKNYRMQRLDEIESAIEKTNDTEKLIELRREAHEIWKDEHDFGVHDKEARKVYDKINIKIDQQKTVKKPEKEIIAIKVQESEFEKWIESNAGFKAYTNQIQIDNKAGVKLRNMEEFKKTPEARAAFEKSKQTPPPSRIEGSSATYNKATGWMAISFSGIPSPEVRAEMKQNGFRYNPSRKQWVAKAYPFREDLAKKYAGTIEEVNIEPNWAAKAEYAATMAAKHEAESDRRYEAKNKIMDNIPFGQPILVDHYSAKGHRSDLNKAEKHFEKSIEEHKIAEKYADRAERYAEKAKGESPGLIYRRIQRLEADKRKMLRNKAEAEEKKSQRSLEWANRWLKLYNDKLDVEYKKYKASGGLATDKVKFKPGDRIYTRHGVGTLVTMSKKTARVKLDPDPRSGREIWLNANRKGESLLSVDDIKAKLTPEQLQTYNQAVERIKAESKIT